MVLFHYSGRVKIFGWRIMLANKPSVAKKPIASRVYDLPKTPREQAVVPTTASANIPYLKVVPLPSKGGEERENAENVPTLPL